MKFSFKRALMLPIMASILMVGCTKDDEETTPIVPTSPVEGKILVATGTATDAEVDIEVYSDQALFVGHNKLYTMLYKQGTKEVISEANVTYKMMMTMGSGMKHTCPMEQPTTTTPTNGVFDGAIIPIMPSGGMGSWNLEVMVTSNNMDGSAMMTVEVLDPTDARVFSFVSSIDGNSYFITMIEPTAPEIGINDFSVAVHMRESMMSFPPVESFIIEIEPEMPSMGHGSINNVDPVHMDMGHYLGKVNFSMSGYWKINMLLKDADGNVLDDTHFYDVNF